MAQANLPSPLTSLSPPNKAKQRQTLCTDPEWPLQFIRSLDIHGEGEDIMMPAPAAAAAGSPLPSVALSNRRSSSFSTVDSPLGAYVADQQSMYATPIRAPNAPRTSSESNEQAKWRLEYPRGSFDSSLMALLASQYAAMPAQQCYMDENGRRASTGTVFPTYPVAPLPPSPPTELFMSHETVAERRRASDILPHLHSHAGSDDLAHNIQDLLSPPSRLFELAATLSETRDGYYDETCPFNVCSPTKRDSVQPEPTATTTPSTTITTPPPATPPAASPMSSRAARMAMSSKRQFLRTKLCPYQLKGFCVNQDDCTYAHSKEELQPLPDLRQTKLCDTVKKGQPCQRPFCPYAHSIQDLKPTSDLATYKTSLCFFWKKSKCFNGPKCRFAHGEAELRPRPIDKRGSSSRSPKAFSKDAISDGVPVSPSEQSAFLQQFMIPAPRENVLTKEASTEHSFAPACSNGEVLCSASTACSDKDVQRNMMMLVESLVRDFGTLDGDSVKIET